MTESFPRQQARTQNFTLGAPRSFQISPDGSRVVFLRSQAGSDPVTCLWVLDLPSGQERLVADPAATGQPGQAEPAEEQARRERAREIASGVVAFATDAAAELAVFGVGGQVWAAGRRPASPPPARPPPRAPPTAPRPAAAGRRVAYVCEGALRITDLATGEDRELIGPAGVPDLTFGLAEFVAAEEMERMRGYWWAPDGSALLVARVDNSGVNQWHIADPANPHRPPTVVRYPAAGTPNAQISIFILKIDNGAVPVEWAVTEFPYLVTASWDHGEPLIVVQTRDQRRMRLLAVDPATGATRLVREDADPRWLDIVTGVPARTSGGRIVWTADAGGARRLRVASEAEHAAGAAEPVTPATLQVRSVLGVDGETVLLSASESEPSEIGVWTWGPSGLTQVSGGGICCAGGVHGAVRAAGITVLTSRDLNAPGVATRVLAESGGADESKVVAEIASLAERPGLPAPRVELLRAGAREIRTALLLPSWHEPGSSKLPVLMDPYGGPHAQRVLAAAGAFLTPQWLADQGFAVVVADGRGTPGRGPEWDRAVAGDLAGPVLDDQVAALEAAAARNGDLDLTRVGIRGWSFGGYLAALAVLRRPDVFHAAVAGAPVTDWRLYAPHYTERYLGDPAQAGAAYDASSLIGDAHRLRRALMIIHGLADDNVVVAHTLLLSSALLAAGRPHSVLPLTGVTHLAAREEVAENLLLLQVDFLRKALGMPAPANPGRDAAA